MRIPGAISMMKSLNVTPSLAKLAISWSLFPLIASGDIAEPIMMFGGSPIIVAAPPMFEKSTSEMRIGIGFKSRTCAILMVTGVRRSIVVTLSKNADRIAVTTHKITTRVHISPPLFLYAWTANHSNTPVCEMIPTMTIIPSRRPIVSQSIIVVTALRLSASSTE